MDVAQRIRILRKKVKQSQIEFGRHIGVSRDVINNLENHRVEPAEWIIKLICAEYGVSDAWLREGRGEMFKGTEDQLSRRVNELLKNENETARAVFEAFVSFDDEDWKTVQKFIHFLKSK